MIIFRVAVSDIDLTVRRNVATNRVLSAIVVRLVKLKRTILNAIIMYLFFTVCEGSEIELSRFGPDVTIWSV